jgi:hypothetical protein
MANYTGRITENRDGWDTPNGNKITTIKPGVYTFSAPAGGWVNLLYVVRDTLRMVWTKSAWVADFKPVDPPSPDPDPQPEPTTEYILHVKDGITRKFVPE